MGSRRRLRFGSQIGSAPQLVSGSTLTVEFQLLLTKQFWDVWDLVPGETLSGTTHLCAVWRPLPYLVALLRGNGAARQCMVS